MTSAKLPTVSEKQELRELFCASRESIDYQESWKEVKKRRIQRIQRLLIVIFIVFYMVYMIARSLQGSRNAARLQKDVYNMIHRLDRVGLTANRSFSTAKDGRLPTHYTLPSGDQIPSVALGVWRSGTDEVGQAVEAALRVGYRHIDEAWIYGNEVEVGKAIKSSGIPRKDLWLTSKLWNTFHEPKDVEPALDESLARLGTDYLDLYLIHWPVAFKNDGKNTVDFELTENTYPTWQKLEEMVKKKKVRNIGLSNFNIRRIQNLTANTLKIKPAINQVEINYWFPQPELLKWSKDNGMLLEAYSPLGSAERVKETLNIPEVKAIANKLGITPAQVYISWLVQRGIVVLPKSVTASRVEENYQITALPDDLFLQLEKLATSHKPERMIDPSKRWGVDIWN